MLLPEQRLHIDAQTRDIAFDMTCLFESHLRFGIDSYAESGASVVQKTLDLIEKRSMRFFRRLFERPQANRVERSNRLKSFNESRLQIHKRSPTGTRVLVSHGCF